MRKVAALCASIIGVGALVGILMAGGSAPDAAHAQTGMAGMEGGPGGAMGGGATETAEAAPAAPSITVTRQTHEVSGDEDVVVDVVNGAVLQLQEGVDGSPFVRLEGVLLPREAVRMRSDWAAYQGSGDPWDWRRSDGLLYKEGLIPDEDTYGKGDDELRAFVMNKVINRKVSVTKTGTYTLANGDKIPKVRVSYTVPQVMLNQDTGPFDLNEQVVAEMQDLGLWNCAWDNGNPKGFDITTQTWAK